MPIDHDRNFKELLSAFFLDFVDLFLPEVASYLDRSYDLIPLDKELFTDVTLGERHEVDLLMKAKVHGQESFFLVHVENQSTSQADFPQRMFRYFARLTEKYNLPVYPVVLFSFSEPHRPEPSAFTVSFPGKTVLQFEYDVIQLNRLDWRSFARIENPVASALMAKMKMRAEDRPRVRLECLRLLATLKLDPARSKLIGGFIDAYLQLNAREMAQYERELATLLPAERKETMGLISSWEQKGIEEGISQGFSQGISQGISQGKEELVSRLIVRRFGPVSQAMREQLEALPPAQLDELGESLLDFRSPDELQQWLAQRSH